MRAYIAGKFTSQDRLRKERAKLRSIIACECTWMDTGYRDYSNTPHTVEVDNAKRDIADVETCDVFIIDTLDESVTGGREVELGVALYLGQIVFLVGPQRNIFHKLAHWQYDSWDDFWDSAPDVIKSLVGQ